MKKILLIIFFLGIYSFANSQDNSGVKSNGGVQAGFLGGWFFNEVRISEQAVLRIEFALNVWFYEVIPDDAYVYPSISAETRWYYNIHKRNKKNKITNKNSADFISIKGVFVPGLAHIPQKKGYSFNNSIAIIPYWGIRREIAKNVFAELGIGVGYEFYFGKNSINNNLLFLPHFRIGM